MKPRLKKKLKSLPRKPGVYLMKDKRGRVIYVGKAASLADRVRAYFVQPADLKSLILTSQISDLEVIPVASEAEALVLENNLIKQYQPKYNVNLKDGKSYPFLKITREPFPSLRIVREERNDKARYWGPFTSVKNLKELVKFLRSYYPIRNCTRKIDERRIRPCTQYYIKRCAGPCSGKISPSEYRSIVAGISAFFSGRYKSFTKTLGKQLRQAVKNLQFEEAQKIKERIFLLDDLKERLRLRDETELVSYGKENALALLGKMLKLGKIPYIIEGYDISNLGGTLATGSKVSFKAGWPAKEGYRHFKIRTVAGTDDCQMLKEVLRRRFDSREERKEIPDLILIDGGRGQLTAATAALKESNLNIPVLALAKQHEELYLAGLPRPWALPKNSPVLHLLQRIRNEAHRFATKYHKLLRVKRISDTNGQVY